MSYKTFLEKFTTLYNKIISYTRDLRIVIFLKNLRKRMNSSVLVFGMVALLSLFFTTFLRSVYIYVLNLEWLWDSYIITTILSFTILILVILLKYVKTFAFFKKANLKRAKVEGFKQFVNKNHNLERNFFFKKFFPYLIFAFNFSIILNNSCPGLASSTILFIFSCVLFLYFLNSSYIFYYYFKTPVPREMLFEPPKTITYVCTRVLKKSYTTGSSVWVASRASSSDVAIAVSTAVASAIGADMAISSMTHQNMYLTRLYDLSKYGWYTPDPKTRGYMLDLQERGETPSDYIQQGTNQLDKWRVRQQYQRLKASGYKKFSD